jgi:glycosyltransferase involved in cell wall biosynthesis
VDLFAVFVRMRLDDQRSLESTDGVLPKSLCPSIFLSTRQLSLLYALSLTSERAAAENRLHRNSQMRILMSAFACGPAQGSEADVGWHWAVEAAKRGHDVTVITQTLFKDQIEREIASGSLPKNLHFDIFMPSRLEKIWNAGLNARWHFLNEFCHIVHLAWQFAALRHIRRNYRIDDFDLVHHVTYAMIRHPTLLGALGLPLVLGPLGGGGRIQMRLRKSFGWLAWCTELLRDAHTLALRADPITNSACRQAQVLFVRDEDTKRRLPRSSRDKAIVHIGVGVEAPQDLPPNVRAPGEPLRLIFAGRLLYLKGLQLGIAALAHTRSKGVDATLTVVGDGPARRGLEALANRLGVASYLTFRAKIPQNELFSLYRRHDALLLPSLRDSASLTVLEALCLGLPVICLALGGPANMVNHTCGRVVEVEGLDEAACAARLAEAITELATVEETRVSLSRGAIVRAKDFSWPVVVAGAYARIEKEFSFSLSRQELADGKKTESWDDQRISSPQSPELR